MLFPVSWFRIVVLVVELSVDILTVILGLHVISIYMADLQKTQLSAVVTRTVRIIKPLPFTPTYEWQSVQRWDPLPAGLEIRMPLDGSPKMARIPHEWNWTVVVQNVAKPLNVRLHVRRDMRIGELRKQIADLMSAARPSKRHINVNNIVTIPSLSDESTVEDEKLFSRRNDVKFAFLNERLL